MFKYFQFFLAADAQLHTRYIFLPLLRYRVATLLTVGATFPYGLLRPVAAERFQLELLVDLLGAVDIVGHGLIGHTQPGRC